MKNKLLLSILTTLTILLISIVCFANDNSNLGKELKASGNKSESTIQNAGEGIMNIASDIGNGIQNAATDMGRGVQEIFNGGNAANNGTTDGTTNGYTATRTATDGGGTTGMTGMGRNAWIWLIMGIVGIAIIALTWYYVTQDHNSSK